MKITKLEAVPLRPLALSGAFATTNVVMNDLNVVIVRAETDEGIVGYGEAMPAWEVTGETQASVVGCVALYQNARLLYADDLLVGRSIATLDDVRAVMERLNPADQPATVMGNTSAKAAIEQALLDACARYQNKTLHDLLGITPCPVPASTTCGIRPVDETLAWVEDKLREKPFAIRLKLGSQAELVGRHSSMERDVEVVRRAAEMIRASGQKTLLVADANEGFVSAPRALIFCRQVEGCLNWLEQPTLGEDVLAFRAIRQQADVPLMADESLHGYGHARLLIELGGVDYFNIKLMKTGGLLAALRIIDLAAEHGIRCQVGSMVESSLGCLMGCYTYMARPAQMVSTDMYAWTRVANDPWHLLWAEGCRVTLADAQRVGTGVDDNMLRSLMAAD